MTSSESDRRGPDAATTAGLLRLECADDLAAQRSIFVATRRGPLDDAGFDAATVERLVEYQFDLRRVELSLSNPAARLEAIVVEGEVVGRLVTDDDGEQGTVVLDIVVAPTRRGEGIGSAALAELIERAGHRRIEVRIDRNSAADVWYRRFGFSPGAGNEAQLHLVRDPDETELAASA